MKTPCIKVTCQDGGEEFFPIGPMHSDGKLLFVGKMEFRFWVGICSVEYAEI